MCWCGGIGRRKGLKIPRTRVRAGSSPATSTIGTGEIYKSSPVLLCLGSNWEVFFARFQPKTGVFVHYLQFVIYFVNFLQNVLLRIGCIASVHARSLNVGVELVSYPFHNKFGIATHFFCPCYKGIA